MRCHGAQLYRDSRDGAGAPECEDGAELEAGSAKQALKHSITACASPMVMAKARRSSVTRRS